MRGGGRKREEERKMEKEGGRANSQVKNKKYSLTIIMGIRNLCVAPGIE